MRSRSAGFFLILLHSPLGAQSPPDAIFRATTQLVPVSVIARNKQGLPVADLRREEFKLFDNGAPVEIRLFVAETEKSNFAPSERKAANAFTNQLAAPAGSHSGYSVILIDDLFSGSDPTNEEGSSLSRSRALEMLRSIPVGERIAIYALRGKLQVICEFTSDRDLLNRQLRKWRPTPTTPAPEPRPSLQALMNPQFEGHAVAEFQRIDELQRALAGEAEMSAMAEHLAGIPGRKNLIWLANKFPVSGRALQSLNRAGVSIYPVDIDGVCRLCPERPHQEMDRIAALTGGVAYYGRNDVNIAIREAMDDGRVSYTLGFYQSGDEKQSAIHRISVRVNRPGTTLRYRSNYESEVHLPEGSISVQDLVHAMNRPVDATSIAITASIARAKDRLDLTATVDASSLDLQVNHELSSDGPSSSGLSRNGVWTGSAELVARFMAADATQAGEVFSNTITFNLRPETYDSALKAGVSFHQELTIPAKAVELKLLIGNLASGKIGTLTIPLSQ